MYDKIEKRENNMKKLILVDGNSIMFRAYFATAYPGAKLMQTKQGIYTNALFAFVGMFEKIVTTDATHALVAFDTKEPTKRHIAYPEYKAGRSKMPEELGMQIPLIHEYLSLNGVKLYSKPGYEADDIIGTLAKRAGEQGYKVEIFSSDRDLLQLVDNNITVNLLKKGMKEVHRFDPEKLFETYELTHNQIIDLKALMGDASDNIPGVPGVGEKTATKLLKQYGTLEAVYANKDEIKGKLGEKIRDNEELAFMSKELVTIEIDAEIDPVVENLLRVEVSKKELASFYQTYELHAFVKKMDLTTLNHEQWEYRVIQDEYELAKILEGDLAIHFEFSDYNYHKCSLWGVGISDGANHYFLTADFALTSINFQMYLADENISKYIYDLKAVQVFLLWQKLELKGVTFDLLLAAYLVDSHLGKEEFKRIVSSFAYEDMLYDDSVYGKGAKKNLPKPATYHRHIASKAKAIHQLKRQIMLRLEEQKQLHLLSDIELPLAQVLAQMEFQGLLVDQVELDKQDKDLTKRLVVIEQEIHFLAGEKFNISSPKQLGEILFDKLELPMGKKTKTGYSTNVDVLVKLENKHPIINQIMQYRQLKKLHSTYIVGLRQNIFADGKVHTIYKQALTTTGRLSSIDPNLQNIPIRTKEGRKIRKLFLPKENHYFIGSDYSQIELRVLADVAQVKSLIEAFNLDQDIHTKTAQEVFHVEKVTSEQRRAAKAVNFGIIYGIGAWSLSDDINVSPKEAQAYIDKYLEIYPEIKTYMDNTIVYAKEHGYVETIMKRRRYIPELISPVYNQRAFGERTALNAPIQGSAADILKKAMIDIFQYLKTNNKKTKLILQVHDELILEVPETEVEEMKEIIPKMMRDAVRLKVELKTSCDIGKNWYELK